MKWEAFAGGRMRFGCECTQSLNQCPQILVAQLRQPGGQRIALLPALTQARNQFLAAPAQANHRASAIFEIFGSLDQVLNGNLVGKVLGTYRLEALVGKGGMSAVFLAQ